MDLERIEKAVREILLAVGEDPEREGLQETPSRVARMYAEIFSGLKSDPKQHLKIFHEEGEHDELVFVRDIPLYSVCEHHLLPFIGKCHIAYIPRDGKIIGLSKFARIVDLLCAASAGAGASDGADCGLYRRKPEPARRGGVH